MRLLDGGRYRYDIVVPDGVYRDCTLGVPGWVNVENSVAAVAALWCAARARGERPDGERLRAALASFEGVKRRFECYINTPRQVYMDDYAHHPRELAATLASVREMFPRPPHHGALPAPPLHADARSVRRFRRGAAVAGRRGGVLLPIYPAREEPIPGVDSQMIARRLTVPWRIVEREALAETVAAMDTDVVISFGAGNIDARCAAIAEN